MATSQRVRWGDAVDDDDDTVLPPPSVTGPDAKGIKTRVEYKKNAKGETVKVTTRTKVLKVEKKMYKVSVGLGVGGEEGERRGGVARAHGGPIDGSEKNTRPPASRSRPSTTSPPPWRRRHWLWSCFCGRQFLKKTNSHLLFPPSLHTQIVEERRAWPRFGDAATESATDSITVRATEEIPFDRVRQARATTAERAADDMKSVLAGSDKSAIVGSLKDMLYKRRMERQLAAARGLISGPELPPSEDGPDGGLLPAAGAKGGYVPPSVRNRGAGGAGESMATARRDENSVRVTNLSEDTREEDVRDLFTPFGQVTRVYVAYDRDTGESRGFAFVNFMYKCVVVWWRWGCGGRGVFFVRDRKTTRSHNPLSPSHRQDAQRAIDKLDGYGYDNLILRVEWAAARDGPGGGPGGRP